MTYIKDQLLYEGKAKKLYSVKGEPDLVIQEFKNSLTAFNGVKKSELEGKGEINQQISSLILRYLNQNGVPSHFVTSLNSVSFVSKKVKIIPLEVVVRNKVAGSLSKKLNIDEGASLLKPIVDFHYKDDALNDPFVSEEQIVSALKVATQKDLEELKTAGLKINRVLIDLFQKQGLELIDFKLEFGRDSAGNIILADEISPDTCRLWDIKTGEKRDKDRFRRDLGNVLESYKIVLEGLENSLKGTL